MKTMIAMMKRIQAVLEGGDLLCEVTSASMMRVAIADCEKRRGTQAVETFGERNTASLSGWINELRLLGAHPRGMDGWLRSSIKTIAAGLTDKLTDDAQRVTTLKEWHTYSLHEIARLETLLSNREDEQPAEQLDAGYFYNLVRHALMDVDAPHGGCRHRLNHIAEELRRLMILTTPSGRVKALPVNLAG